MSNFIFHIFAITVMYCIAQCHILHTYFYCNIFLFVCLLYRLVVHLGTLLLYFLFSVIPLYNWRAFCLDFYLRLNSSYLLVIPCILLSTQYGKYKGKHYWDVVLLFLYVYKINPKLTLYINIKKLH